MLVIKRILTLITLVVAVQNAYAQILVTDKLGFSWYCDSISGNVIELASFENNRLEYDHSLNAMEVEFLNFIKINSNGFYEHYNPQSKYKGFINKEDGKLLVNLEYNNQEELLKSYLKIIDIISKNVDEIENELISTDSSDRVIGYGKGWTIKHVEIMISIEFFELPKNIYLTDEEVIYLNRLQLFFMD